MSSLTWKPHVWPNLHPAQPHELREVESTWNVVLPEDYKRTVSTYQGCSPQPYSVKFPNGGTTGFDVLLTVSTSSAKSYDSVQAAYEPLREHAPPGLYPFARSTEGDYFCLDYRPNPRSPRVVYFYSEEEGEDAIIFLADNFTQFLNNLKD